MRPRCSWFYSRAGHRRDRHLSGTASRHRPRACAVDQTLALLDIPVVVPDVNANIPTLSISAEREGELVPVQVFEELTGQLGTAAVVPVVSSVKAFLLDSDGSPLGLSPSGGPAFSVNWSSLVQQPGFVGLAPPDNGEFMVSEEIADAISLDVGRTYSIHLPTAEGRFIYVGSFETVFGDAFMMVFSDEDALAFLLDGLGYDAVQVWSEDSEVANAAEKAVAESLGHASACYRFRRRNRLLTPTS